uniref:hypothetical protein n=1 Tax=Kitasatospora indigofera TaxID=67307 RepID=UPI002F916EAD
MTRPDPDGIDAMELCDVCGALVPEDEAYLSVVADSSATATEGGELMDGERLLTACTWDHLEHLVLAYEQRPFVREELWAAKMLDTLQLYGHHLTSDQLATASGLTPAQLDHARTWHTHHHLLPHHDHNAGDGHNPAP